MKSSGIGGQAVLEGVMMKNKSRYAVAVRKPDGEIAIEKGENHSIIEKHKILGIPVVRGVVNFVESLVLGMKMLTSSAAYFDDVEEEPGKFERWLQKKFGKKAENIIMGFTVFFSIVMAIAIFMLLPLAVVSFIDEKVISYEWKTLIEGLLRVVIFLGYIVLISQLKDIRRVFMYHGAEHKTINCIERGLAPTVQNVRKCSRLHKRCGTSFLLIVMLISVVFFLLFRVETLWLRFVVRILFVPLIAGISYEFIRLAGSSDSKIVNVLSKPGLWLQGLTTREPDDDMIRVAVASVEAVFDWEAYLEENFGKKNRKKSGKKSSATKETKKQEEKAEPVAGEPVEVPVAATLAVEEPKQTVSEKTEVKPVQATETADVASKFDWSFTPAKKPEIDEEAAKESRSKLAAKVSAADKAETEGKTALSKTAAVNRYNEDEEEDDEILRALDKYFVFEGEKTVMERGNE
ncbi:MAG: DUF1385 domain-containing protein [Lachnospiraceae bacterium]|nr:DUF1385 domain-containing protein [Lachnospiraceae bacterium]